ncbi:MAG: uracil-DNA glycosylase [Pseudomonadota bacterium]
MESALDYWTARAALDWQIEMGVDECIQDAPIDRYALEDKPKPAPEAKATKGSPAPPPVSDPDVDAVAVAQTVAADAQDLSALQAAMAAFSHCPLKDAARNLVFSDGTADAPVMMITDAPDREDDRANALHSGRKGVLFDRMLAAIGWDRKTGVYSVPVLPWNPPQNRAPTAAELAMMHPFLERHIELANPAILVLMGNGPCQSLLGKAGVTRMRGQWAEVLGRPALPMVSPDYLLENPLAKRDAWADLLSLKAKRDQTS